MEMGRGLGVSHSRKGGRMKVLVTGGTGFIGSAVVEELIKRGHTPILFDRSHGNDILTTPIPKADYCIHLAGVLGTHELFDSPHLAVDVNIHGTLNILEACRDFDMGYVGITMPQVFPSVYTATKICSTRLATAWHREFGIPVSHVRAFNAFGPGQAHGPGHPRKIIPAFSVDAWSSRPLTIWGDGEQTVDLIHTTELARMLIDAMGHGDDVTFDGGTGVAFTVNQVAQMVLDISGSKAGTQHLPMRRGEEPTEIVATGEGWDRLSWHPAFDPRALAKTVEWYEKLADEAAA